MDNAKLVSSPSSAADTRTDPAVPESESACSSSQQSAPSNERQYGSGRMTVVWRSLRSRGFCDEAARLVTASWTSGTDKQYNSAWKKWCCWFDERKTDILQAPVTEVANFLSECFADGKSYSTINTYRSALSSTLHPINKTAVGSHPLVTRLPKGVYNLRTPVPRYSTTWDVTEVTGYLKTIFPLAHLSLKSLTLKTVMRCALASSQREQTLYALALNYVTKSEQCLSFVVTERLKTSKPGKSLEEKFECLPSEPSICVKCTLAEYISRTKAFRRGNPELSPLKLFVSYIKPHKPVSTATLARWIKSVLTDAGINTSVFKAHSVRSALATPMLVVFQLQIFCALLIGLINVLSESIIYVCVALQARNIQSIVVSSCSFYECIGFGAMKSHTYTEHIEKEFKIRRKVLTLKYDYNSLRYIYGALCDKVSHPCIFPPILGDLRQCLHSRKN